MKIKNTISTMSRTGIAGIIFMGSFAQAAPSLADLTVQIQAPAQPQVYQMQSYSVVVSNPGRKDASNVSLTIQLPVTATSPTVAIMGNLGSFDSRCTRSGNNLICALGTIAKSRSASRAFQLRLPQSSAPIAIRANVSTSSQESSTGNNSALATPSLGHPSLPILADVSVSNRHCTGTNLTSYFECDLFPSSISQHEAQFLANGDVLIPGYPEYSGHWEQTPGTQQLSFHYEENGNTILNFSGWAVDANCFEGITTFVPADNYVSPYRVCISPL